MAVNLPRDQAAVLAFMFEHAPIDDPADVLDFQLEGAFENTLYAAFSRLKRSAGYAKPTSIGFTLATHNSRVFMSVAEHEMQQVIRALANLERREARGAMLRPGDLVRIPDVFFASRDRVAILLLRPTSMQGLEGFPDSAPVQERSLSFSFAMFLTNEECEFRAQHGHDALLEKFDSEGRSSVVF